jgi:UDP-N-acetylmuramate dehydrogenase
MIRDLPAGGLLRRGVSLAPLTTYRFGGEAAWFAEPTDEEQLSRVLQAAADLGLRVVLLGRGSNVVISERGLDAVVVRLAGRFSAISLNAEGVVTAGAAAPLARLARTSVDGARGGLEFFVGIPGSVGGAVRMNAGCLGSETADWMIDADLISISTGAQTVHTPSGLAMGYRTSAVGDDNIVVLARFRTEPQPTAVGRAKIREVTQWRRKNQPGGTLNAGSVFKNPAGDAAGRIIDSLGLKGLSVGGVRVSPRHANFFEAHEGATAQDVYDLVQMVRGQVKARSGIDLEPEVKFLGSFTAPGGIPEAQGPA